MTEIDISNSRSEVVATLTLGEGELACSGRLPGNLTVDDLKKLGLVYYENDARGLQVARVREVPAGDNLEYLRALKDALPPGYFVAKVRSLRIEAEKQMRREKFEREIEMIDDHPSQEG